MNYTPEFFKEILGKEITFNKEFKGDGSNFSAFNEASKYLSERGFTLGSMQGSLPIGIALDADYVSKWRGLDREEKKQLDGAMCGDMRNGPVMVYFTINPFFI